MPRRLPLLLAACLLCVGHAAEIPAVSLAGVIDIHCHTAPDVFPRIVTDFELARLARDAGMRGIVLKNHYTMTADRAQLVMHDHPGVDVFGGIALNRSVGGLNAEAVRRMAAMDGHRGKIVWLPTFDAENQVRFSHENRPFVSVMHDGQIAPELTEIFKVIAENDLVLATGHSSADESLRLIAAAQAAGVKRIVVTHVLADTIRATPEHMETFARLGAVMECAYLTHLTNTLPSPAPPVALNKAVPIADCARAIKRIGAEHFLLSSDLGRQGAPNPIEGMRAFIGALKSEGLDDNELDLITRQNPARLLGLAPSR